MLLPYLLLLTAMLSIQTGAGFAKQLFPLAGPAGVSTLRLVFASLILVLIFRPWNHKFSRGSLKNLFIYGASLGLMNLTFYFAIARIPLGIAVALEFLGPLSVAIFSSKRKLDYLWALLAALGIFFILPETNIGAAIDYVGVFFAVLAGMFWAFYIIFGQKAGQDIHGGIAASMGMVFAMIMVLPFGLFFDGARLSTPGVFQKGLMVAILSSALPYTLEMFSLKKMPAKTFGILMSIEPVIACLVGIILLGEQLSFMQWSAVACIIVASFGSSLTKNN